jgi:AcrR family transcriptional regulator
MAQGFETASVDEIARVSGVNKATLYFYFPDKVQLFVEVVRSECA